MPGAGAIPHPTGQGRDSLIPDVFQPGYLTLYVGKLRRGIFLSLVEFLERCLGLLDQSVGLRRPAGKMTRRPLGY
jgi:hypothetical protein